MLAKAATQTTLIFLTLILLFHSLDLATESQIIISSDEHQSVTKRREFELEYKESQGSPKFQLIQGPNGVKIEESRLIVELTDEIVVPGLYPIRIRVKNDQEQEEVQQVILHLKVFSEQSPQEGQSAESNNSEQISNSNFTEFPILIQQANNQIKNQTKDSSPLQQPNKEETSLILQSSKIESSNKSTSASIIQIIHSQQSNPPNSQKSTLDDFSAKQMIQTEITITKILANLVTLVKKEIAIKNQLVQQIVEENKKYLPLKQKADELKKKMEQININNLKIREGLTELDEQRVKKSQEMNIKQLQLQEGNREQTNAKQAIQRIKKQLKNIDANLQILRAETEMNIKDVKEIQEEIMKIEEVIYLFKLKIEEKKQISEAIESSRIDVLRKINNSKNLIKALNQQLQTELKNLSFSEVQLNLLDSQSIQVENIQNSLQAGLKENESLLKQKKDQSADHKQKIQFYENLLIPNLLQKRRTFENNRRTLQKHLQQIKIQMNTLSLQIPELKKEIQSLEERLQFLAKQDIKNQNQLSIRFIESKILESQLKEMETKIARLQQKIKQSEKKIKDLNDSIEKVREDQKVVNQALDSLVQKNIREGSYFYAPNNLEVIDAIQGQYTVDDWPSFLASTFGTQITPLSQVQSPLLLYKKEKKTEENSSKNLRENLPNCTNSQVQLYSLSGHITNIDQETNHLTIVDNKRNSVHSVSISECTKVFATSKDSKMKEGQEIYLKGQLKSGHMEALLIVFMDI